MQQKVTVLSTLSLCLLVCGIRVVTILKYRVKRMATRRHRNSDKANEWARKRAEAMALAKKRREERKRGQVSEEHTFKPQQISKPPSREGGGIVIKIMAILEFLIGMDVMCITTDKISRILFHKIFKPKTATTTTTLHHPSNSSIFNSLGGRTANSTGLRKTSLKSQKCQSSINYIWLAMPSLASQGGTRNLHRASNIVMGNSSSKLFTMKIQTLVGLIAAMPISVVDIKWRMNLIVFTLDNLRTCAPSSSTIYNNVHDPRCKRTIWKIMHHVMVKLCRLIRIPLCTKPGGFTTTRALVEVARATFCKRNHSQIFSTLKNKAKRWPGARSTKKTLTIVSKSWLRSDDDSKSKSISKSGWNSDFTDAGTLSRYDSEEHKPVKRKPARRKAKPVEKKRPEWNNDWADVGNVTQHNSQESHMQGNRRANVNNAQARQQPKQGGTYRKMINPSDILGSDSHGQGSMTPPQVSSRLRLLKKKVKRKESFSNGYDDQNVSSGNYNNVGDDSYSQYQQPMNHAQPARRTQHQRVQQHGWGGSKDVNRSSSGQVNYGADHEDPFGQNKSKTLSYHDIDNQPLGGGGGGGYNPRFDDADDGSYVQEVAPTQHTQRRNHQQPNQQRQRQPQQRQRQPQQRQRQPQPQTNAETTTTNAETTSY